MADPLTLPRLGFGCSPIDPSGAWRDLGPLIGRALDTGYRLFDTAELYGTEALLGAALSRRRSGSGEAVVVSKLWSTHHRPPLVRAACERSLRRLGVERIDLYLLHTLQPWRPRVGAPALLDTAAMQAHARAAGTEPGFEPDDVPLAETWAALRSLVDAGLVGAIGVSNAGAEELGTLVAQGLRPAVDQFACHLALPQRQLVSSCRDAGVVPMAHSPLAGAGRLTRPDVVAVARRFGRTPAQVALRWLIGRGIVPIPSTRRPERLAENLAAADDAWPPEARAALAGLAGEEAAPR